MRACREHVFVKNLSNNRLEMEESSSTGTERPGAPPGGAGKKKASKRVYDLGVQDSFWQKHKATLAHVAFDPFTFYF